jgi:branched-chain amino acid transport system substrate-binding protein
LGITVSGDGIEAAELAVEEINAAGGIHGRPLELVAIPDRTGGAAGFAIAAAERFAADPSILAVIGHSNSATSLAAAKIYNARGLPQIAPVATSPLFALAGPYSFRLVPDDRLQAEFMAQQVKENPAVRRVAILYVNDDYGRGLYGELRQRLVEAGVHVVYEAPYLEGAAPDQLESGAREVIGARPQMLFWLGRFTELRRVLPPLRAGLPDLAILASDGLEAGVTYGLPDSVAVGIRVVRFVDPEGPDPRLQAFRERFRDRTGRDVYGGAVLTYDAVGLLADALRSGARSREAIREYLTLLGRYRAPYAGISGPIAFNEEGTMMRSLQLAEVTATGLRRVPVR